MQIDGDVTVYKYKIEEFFPDSDHAAFESEHRIVSVVNWVPQQLGTGRVWSDAIILALVEVKDDPV